jgi:hypothetical protein
VLAHEGRTTDAEQAFERARAALEHHGLAVDQAGLLHRWGRLLAAPERLDEAAALHRRLRTGPFWLERVAADRRAMA